MNRRDPLDERRDERLAGSTLASILLHLLAAAFLISIAASSSQESANETTVGGTLLTVSQQIPVVRQAATPHPAPPQPVTRHVAAARHVAMHPMLRPRPVLHELSHVVPSATPNPTPVPAFTPQPLPAPTLAVALAQPTLAPTAKPTVEPTVRPAPSSKPAPTARPVPSAMPTRAPTQPPTQAPAPVVAHTAAPQPTAAIASAAPSPLAKPSVAPSSAPGVPSPHPVVAEHQAAGHASPGPQNATAGRSKASPRRPIAVELTPSPRPTERPRPRPTRNPYTGLNARLNALLPSGPVTPHEGHYVGSLSLAGRLEPTPPPAVVARTRYTFEGPAGGGDGRLKMWVTTVTRRGPLLFCTGWIVHYPESIGQGLLTAPGNPARPANGIQIGSQHSVPSGFSAGMAPIVVGIGTTVCSERALVPFTP